jgi:aryl-alcohol dehydrogenase-like predicted oxidoreductase
VTPVPTFRFPLRLGFGCSGPLAARWHSARQTERVIRAALDAGVRHFDTAPFYGEGEGERRLGAALKGFSEPVFVSTKTGTLHRWPKAPLKDFSEASVRRDVEGSLRRLQREQVDCVYLHGPSETEEIAGLAALALLREEGKVRLAGVCAAGENVPRAAAAQGVDAVMAAYNFLHPENAPHFALAKKRGKLVVAIAPLAQGHFRRTAPLRLADVWRAARRLSVDRDELARARAARPLLASAPGWTAAQLALAFVQANTHIDAALTTTTRPAHLAELVDAASRQPPPEALAALNALTLPKAAPS